MPQLLDLPPEIVVQALCYLDLPDLASVARTSSCLRSYTQTFPILQYRFATQAAGVEDNPHCNLSISERLALLKGREDGWANLKFDCFRTIPVQHASSRIYDVAAGIYLLGDANQREVHYCRLPSKPSDLVEWSRIDIDRTLVGMGLAIYEHDLIALITITPHQSYFVIEVLLLQFSTGKPHPLARRPVLFVTKTPWPRPSIGIKIVGTNLALVTNHFLDPPFPPDHFYIFDWRSGVRKMDIAAVNHTYSGLVFLSPDLVLLPNTARPPGLDIWAIPSSHSTTTVPTHPLLSLGLPPMSSDYFIMNLSCRSEPNPSPHGTPHAQTPFLATPADALIIFNIRVHHVNLGLPHGNTFSIFARRSTFLGLAVEARKPRLDPGTGEPEPVSLKREQRRVFVPWDTWGPPNTRWFNGRGTVMPWITTSAGQRCVISVKLDVEGSSAPLMVLDFNPLTLRRVLARRPEERRVVVASPTRIVDEAFREPVESTLAYATRILLNSGDADGFAGVMMDEERLLRLKMVEDTIVEIEVLHVGAVMGGESP